MNNAIPLIRRLQSDAVDDTKSVTSLLRLAKLVAEKLKLSDALVWMNNELDGYPDVPASELPAYRQLHGEAKGYNPYHGWQPLQFSDADSAEACSYAPVGQALGAIEQGLSEPTGGGFLFPYPTDMKNKLVQSTGVDVRIELSKGQVFNIVDQVRNLVLNWSLELEKAGILGEGMTFSEEEKVHAAPVTQNFFVQNAGVIGHVSGSATVENRQTAEIKLDFDLPKVSEFLAQGFQALDLLPDHIRGELEPILRDLESEVGRERPDQGRLKSWLLAARKVAEGAAGNLAASGIISLVSGLLPT